MRVPSTAVAVDQTVLRSDDVARRSVKVTAPCSPAPLLQLFLLRLFATMQFWEVLKSVLEP